MTVRDAASAVFTAGGQMVSFSADLLPGTEEEEEEAKKNPN